MTLPLVRPGSPLGTTVLFLGGGRSWTVDDAVVDAASRGALDRAIEETLALVAAEERAEDEGIDIDDDALQQSSERFRYDHDLISAGETEEWLAARGMTVDDFSDWLYARLCLDPSGAPRPSAAVASPPPKDFQDRLLIHLWLSGEMDRITEEFRRRVAAQMELANENVPIDAAHERVVRSVLTDAARRQKLEMLRLSLTRLRVDWLELESEAAAREAVLCVRDDRETLAEVAAGAGYATRSDEMWADDAAAMLTPQASFASDGELVGPIRVADRFKLCQVVRRIEPSLADAEVAARVDTMLLDEYFTDLCARHTPLPVTARTSK